jgi:peptide/nickel transport system substrate-binding protein
MAIHFLPGVAGASTVIRRKRMRWKHSLVAAGVATALLLTGCSSSTPAETATGPALTIAKPDGAIATESNNPWIGDSSALKLGYVNTIFEPLAFVNVIADKPVTPWLASEITWADDYKSVTVTARDNVKWNDGEDFTADDIAFTFKLMRDNPAIESAALGITDAVVDGNKVTISFANSVYVKQDKVLEKFIVPEHI